MPFEDFLIDNEAPLRLGIFFGVLVLLGVVELAFPKRERTFKRVKRWRVNLVIALIDTLALRFLLPILAVGTALWVEMNQIGLLEILNWPGWLEVLLAVILLDMLVYGQHVAFHHIPIFWRIHRVHHADRDIDVTTALRFHPVEIVLSMLLKIAFVVVLGAPVVAVICFEILLNAMAMFNHSNLRLPTGVDRWLRLFVVTPDMHRVHHSIDMVESNRNFGFSLSIWDRIFSTYKAQPDLGHGEMVLGLEEYQGDESCRLGWTLCFPFFRR